MDYETIIFEKKEGIAKITLNRPDRLNAVNPKLSEEVHNALEDIRKDGDIKVVVVTGAPRVREKEGKKEIRHVFSSGWDMVEAAAPPYIIPDELQDFEKPVIAMVNGLALGGGNEILLGCDFIFASENSEFGQPEIERGFMPGWGGTQRLPRRIGIGRAKMINFTGDRISAREAERMGLVDVVAPMEKLEETVMEFARKLAGKAPLAIRKIKEVMNRGMDTDLKSGLKLERDGISLLSQTEDFQEGIAAFLEKRSPKWKGK